MFFEPLLNLMTENAKIQYNLNNKPKNPNYYFYIVGVRNLDLKMNKNAKEIKKYNHACIKLDKDIFEYGINSKKNKEKTYTRHKNIGWDRQFDWSYLGDYLYGVSEISPDELEEEIIKSKKWAPGHFSVLFNNCHSFVKFCLKKLGCPKYDYKFGTCFNPDDIQERDNFDIRNPIGFRPPKKQNQKKQMNDLELENNNNKNTFIGKKRQAKK